MNILLIANIIALAGSVLMLLIGLIKSKKNILLVQNVQFALLTVSNFLLGGISGSISNILGIIRNFICLKTGTLSCVLKVIFIAAQLVLTVIFNQSGWLGYLPLAATTALTLLMDTKNVILLKCAIIFGQVCWMIYDFTIQSYTSFVFDALTVITNIVGIVMVLKDRES